jgi:hypothetical protein
MNVANKNGNNLRLVSTVSDLCIAAGCSYGPCMTIWDYGAQIIPCRKLTDSESAVTQMEPMRINSLIKYLNSAY